MRWYSTEDASVAEKMEPVQLVVLFVKNRTDVRQKPAPLCDHTMTC